MHSSGATAYCGNHDCKCHSTTKQGWEERFENVVATRPIFDEDGNDITDKQQEFFNAEITKAQVEVLDELQNWVHMSFSEKVTVRNRAYGFLATIRSRITSSQDKV